MLWPGEHAAVVEVPDLGPLVLGVPLAELVAEREHALLGARLLLVAPRRRRTARRSRSSRRPRAAPASGSGCASRWAPRCTRPRSIASCDRGDDQLQAELLDPAVAVGEDRRRS